MELFVATTARGRQEVIPIEVLPTDTIKDIKFRIEDTTGIKAGIQRLIFCGKMLEDDRTLYDYNMHNESTVHLILTRSTILLERTATTVETTVNTAANDTSVDTTASDTATTKTINVTIKVLSFHGGDKPDITMEVCLDDKIGMLKLKLEENVGTPAGQQRLYQEGHCLENTSTFRDSNIHDQDTLKLIADYDGGDSHVQQMNLVVTDSHAKKRFTIDVHPEDTIAVVKHKIEEMVNVLPEEQQLFTRTIELKDDTATLRDYYIFHNETLFYLHKSVDGVYNGPIHINILTLSGKTEKLQVETTQTILDVKKQYQLQTGIPHDQQRLIDVRGIHVKLCDINSSGITEEQKEFFDRKDMEDYRTISAYHILSETTLLILLKKDDHDHHHHKCSVM